MIHRPSRGASRRHEVRPGPASRSGHDRRSYTTGWDAILSDGAKRFVMLGGYPAHSLDEARTWALGLRAEIARGADPAAGIAARKASVTFAALTDDWLQRHGERNKSPRALQDDRSMLSRHVLPAIGAMKADQIEKRDLIRLLDAVAAAPDARLKAHGGAKPRALTHRPNRVFELVRSIFRWSVRRDVLKVDPTAGLAPPIAKEKPRDRELSPDEIAQLWAALERAPAQRRLAPKGHARGEKLVGECDVKMTRATALAMQLSLVTAQRIGEVAGIAVAELDLNDLNPVWTVPAERSKNGRPNRVPLSPLALRLISEARALAPNSPWLFPGASGLAPIDPHAATKALGRARAAIGLADFRVHDLRRTAATRMAEIGINPHTISLILNHVSARAGTITSKVYVQYSYDREKREALAAWGQRLQSILDGKPRGNVYALSSASSG